MGTDGFWICWGLEWFVIEGVSVGKGFQWLSKGGSGMGLI